MIFICIVNHCLENMGLTCLLVKKSINKNIKNPCEWMTWGDIF